MSIAQFEKRLEGMPTPYLMQYAQQDQGPEGAIALMLLKERKRLQLANAPKAAPDAPTVRERELAQLAGAGIAQAAPSNVAAMAGGGLASLVQDDVPRYNGSEEQLVREWQTLPSERGGAASSMGEFLTGMFSRNDRKIDPDTGQPISFAEFRRKREQVGAAPDAYGPTSGWARDRLQTPAAGAGARKGQAKPTGPRATPAAPPVAPPVAPPAAQAPDYTAQFRGILGKMEDPLAAERNEQFGLEAAAAESARRARESAAEQGSALLKSRGARLDRQERDLAKERNSNIAFSLIEAGATIAATPGPMMAAIASGLRVGGRQYQAGLIELRKSQQLISAARERLEDAQLGNDREKAMAGVDAQRMVAEANARRLAGIQRVYDVNAQTAKAILEQQALDARQTTKLSAEERMQATNLAAQERMSTKSDAARIQAAQIAAEAGAEGRALRDRLAESGQVARMREKLLEEWNKSAEIIRRRYPNVKSFEDFLMLNGVPSLGAAAGTPGLNFEGAYKPPK